MRRREFVVSESSVTEHFTSDEPIDIFEGIFTGQLIDLIVENTAQSMAGREFVRISWLLKLEPVTALDYLDIYLFQFNHRNTIEINHRNFEKLFANNLGNLFPVFTIERANLFIYRILYNRVANYSNKTKKILPKLHKLSSIAFIRKALYLLNVSNKDISLNRFHTLFWFFYCWLWTSRYRLGRLFIDLLIYRGPE